MVRDIMFTFPEHLFFKHSRPCHRLIIEQINNILTSQRNEQLSIKKDILRLERVNFLNRQLEPWLSFLKSSHGNPVSYVENKLRNVFEQQIIIIVEEPVEYTPFI